MRPAIAGRFVVYTTNFGCLLCRNIEPAYQSNVFKAGRNFYCRYLSPPGEEVVSWLFTCHVLIPGIPVCGEIVGEGHKRALALKIISFFIYVELEMNVDSIVVSKNITRRQPKAN